MAKIKFGMFMTDARGKIGGHVFSKNRSGAYVRTKVTPSNGRSLRQQAVRSLLGAISQAWSGLSSSARASFNEAVASWSRTDIFGDIRNPTGKNLFTRLNINLANTGQAQITTAPEKLEMPTLDISSVDLSAGLISINAVDIPAGGQVLVSATAPQSAGTAFFKGKFRQIQVVDSATLDGADLTDSYTEKFGVPADGANVQFEFKLILANGQSSVPVTLPLKTV